MRAMFYVTWLVVMASKLVVDPKEIIWVKGAVGEGVLQAVVVVYYCPLLSFHCTCTPHTVSGSQTWWAGRAEPLEHSAVSSASQRCPDTHSTGCRLLSCDRSCLLSPPWSESNFPGGGRAPGQAECQSRGPESVRMKKTVRAVGRSS